MKDRLRQVDITNYALNELEPRERMYVESIMLGCDSTRTDVLEMIEMAQLLEEGFEAELGAQEFTLDASRRGKVLGNVVAEGVWHHVWRATAAAVTLAACLVFSVAAPVVWNSATRPAATSSDIDLAQGLVFEDEKPDVASTLQMAVSAAAAAAVAVFEDQDNAQAGTEEFPTRILLPTGTVGLDMPSLGGDAN
jgi:anti-sigma factor RsiW